MKNFKWLTFIILPFLYGCYDDSNKIVPQDSIEQEERNLKQVTYVYEGVEYVISMELKGDSTVYVEDENFKIIEPLFTKENTYLVIEKEDYFRYFDTNESYKRYLLTLDEEKSQFLLRNFEIDLLYRKYVHEEKMSRDISRPIIAEQTKLINKKYGMDFLNQENSKVLNYPRAFRVYWHNWYSPSPVYLEDNACDGCLPASQEPFDLSYGVGEIGYLYIFNLSEGGGNWNDKISSFKLCGDNGTGVSGIVTFYLHHEFGGSQLIFSGNVIPKMSDMPGNWDNCISSVRFRYEHIGIPLSNCN